MSSVRMCDKCGTIFSERADGWSTFTGTKVSRDENGKMRQQTEVLDTCPQCSIGGVTEPRLALTASAGAERIADTQTQADRDRITNQGHNR